MLLKKTIHDYFGKGHERTLKAKKNIFFSFIIKGLNIAVGLALVPLTLNYLNPTKYGVWITLSSIITWVGFFDIGFGNGLRNRFAEAVAKGNHELAKTYVSTTYAILLILVAGILLVFYFVNPFINWVAILNTGEDIPKSDLSLLALIVFTFFCLQFVFKLITTILTADQQPAKASFFDFIGKLLSLVTIFTLTKTTNGSLIYLGIALSGIPVFILLVSSIWFYSGKYKKYRPEIKNIDFGRAKDLLSLGLKFFIIQFSSILLFQTNSIIISHLFGPAEVTPYNIAYRYFSIILMAFSIIVTPFWSAFTEAWEKKEVLWIKNVIQKLNLIWIMFFIAGTIMMVFSNDIYSWWVGDKILISYSISILVGIWTLLITWNGIYIHFLNGVGKIKIQLYTVIVTSIINIPMAIYLGKHFGIEGILISNILSIIIGVFLYPMQYNMLLKGNAKGIFNQ